MFDHYEVAVGNDEYIDNSSARLIQVFNNTLLIIYLRPCKVVFENGSKIKQDFTPLIKDFGIKPVSPKIKTHKPTLQWSNDTK